MRLKRSVVCRGTRGRRVRVLCIHERWRGIGGGIQMEVNAPTPAQLRMWIHPARIPTDERIADEGRSASFLLTSCDAEYTGDDQNRSPKSATHGISLQENP